MNFSDDGIIINKQSIKEHASVVTLFTRNNGLYSGYIRSSSKKLSGGVAAGNLVNFSWQARLHEHLGSAKCELIKAFDSHIIMNKTKLYAFNSVVSLIKKSFHEREPHNNFFPIFLGFLEKLKLSFNFEDYIKVELAILAEAGYALQLEECGDTGEKHDLHYVSPKSGRAISKTSGTPYESKLLILPQFFITELKPALSEVMQAANLTAYFFERHVFNGKKMPEERQIFIRHVLGLE